jgi:hypothetical protein
MSNPTLPGVEDYDAIRAVLRRLRAHAFCPRMRGLTEQRFWQHGACPCTAEAPTLGCPPGWDDTPAPGPDPLADVRAEIARRYGDFPWRR